MERLADGISCHVWNKDRSSLCICPNNNEIWIYSGCKNQDMSKWKKEHVLTEHDMVVSGLDWSPVHDMIVSCSHDRNAFVWKYDPRERKWKPELVILRINRAATNVKWSPDGKKFAVSSGAKCIAICYYEPHNNWWISKMIKKHKSTILDIAWHPNSQLLATASTDMRCRVVSAIVSDLDKSANSGPYAQLAPFGEVMAEFDQSSSWVEAVAWSQNGDKLVFTGHDSSIHFVEYRTIGALPTIQSLRFKFLPFERVMFLSDSLVIGCGHDFNVHAFSYNSKTGWVYAEALDKKDDQLNNKKNAAGFSAARNIWENKVVRGQGAAATLNDKDVLWTKHESAITQVQPYAVTNKGDISCITSSALDGRLVFWKLDTLNLQMIQLSV